MSLQQLTGELYQSFDKQDYEKCEKLLVPVKVELVKHNLLVPLPSNSDSKNKINDLKIAQKILEIGALSSLLSDNYSGFENYYSQLKQFYINSKIHPKKETNSETTKIVSLYLLYLLSQGLISKFHIELEALNYYEQFDIEQDEYLKFPIDLEKNLMEGNYIKIWKLLKSDVNLPCNEYQIFIPTLIVALRFEIAKSLEKTYKSMPINNCKNLLYYPQEESDKTFQQSLQQDLDILWGFKDGYVYFNTSLNEDEVNIDAPNKLIHNVLNYAEQLESII